MHENALHPSQARRVVALAFLGALAAWEDFVEAVFVRYLAGATSPSGHEVTLRAGRAVSISHAYELVSGQKDYDPLKRFLVWSSPKEIVARADIFFYQGQPFRSAVGHWRDRLQDASVIRNRVAHHSQKARREFKAVALGHLGRPKTGKLTQGYSPGDLLVETSVRGFTSLEKEWRANYFLAYLNMFVDLADRLVP
jgi:hypothetical protein